MYFKFLIFWKFAALRLQKRIYYNRLPLLQEKRWKRFQTTLLNSSFYKENAINKASLEEYPIQNKALFMENFNTINTHKIKLKTALAIAIKAEQSRDFSPMIGHLTVGLSSGTSGNKGVFIASESERAHWVAAILDRVIGFSLKKRTVAFFLRANSNLYDSVKSKLLRFEFFDLYEPINNHMNRLNQLQPTILVAQPSMLLELAVAYSTGKLKIHPQKIISVAEVLYPEDKKILETTFNQIIHQVYQCTEGFLATTCNQGTLHFNEDFLIIEKEYIDDSNTRFYPVITDLLRSSQPIVRYHLNDIITEKTNCTCGQKTLAIDQIEGRSDDILIFKNNYGIEIPIYPDFCRRAIIISDDSITDYELIQRSANQIALFINGTERMYQHAKQAIHRLLSNHDIAHIDIIRSTVKKHSTGDKLRRIRNDYK
ncbi:hypothetical protein GCM10022393_34020 [Aquimarina addita]|uniref:Adenylate synthase n=1 Tax=Aquimarina addita TaxID=870485 RepID=A0ABP6USI1_9FLAO